MRLACPRPLTAAGAGVRLGAMTTRLYTLSDLQRVAALALRHRETLDGEQAAAQAVADVVAAHPPFYSEQEVRDMLRLMYTLAQIDYREQTCRTEQRMLEVLGE